MTDGCVICARMADASGVVLDTPRWRSWVHDGYEVPGWIITGLRRHAEGPAGMDDVEQREFGRVVGELSRALIAVTGAERTYLVGFGEAAPHWHFLLATRGADVPADERGPALLARRDELIDPERARVTAAAVARQLADFDPSV